jgi:outer membrane protein TolC
LSYGLFLWALPVFAQEKPPLSLEQAIREALSNNRQFLAAQQDRQAAASGMEQARGAFFPRLDVVEGFSYSDKPTLVFSSLLDQASFKQQNFAISSLNQPTPLTNLSSQIRVEQPLYTGGKLSAELAKAKASFEAVDGMTRRIEQDVVARTTEAYYTVLLVDGSLGVINRALLSARGHLELTRDLVDKGLAVRSDLLRTQVLMGTLEREKLEAENLAVTTRSRLRHLLGMEEGRFTLTERVTEDDLALEGLSGLVEEARKARPDLKAAEKEVEGATEFLRSAQADYYPSLGLVTQVESNAIQENSVATPRTLPFSLPPDGICSTALRRRKR